MNAELACRHTMESHCNGVAALVYEFYNIYVGIRIISLFVLGVCLQCAVIRVS